MIFLEQISKLSVHGTSLGILFKLKSWLQPKTLLTFFSKGGKTGLINTALAGKGENLFELFSLAEI